MASDTVVVGRTGSARFALQSLDIDAALTDVSADRLAEAIADREARGDVRWVWPDCP